MVLEVTPDKQVHCVSRSKGYQIIQAKSIILCMGCRERTRRGHRHPAPARREFIPPVQPSAMQIWKATWWADGY